MKVLWKAGLSLCIFIMILLASCEAPEIQDEYRVYTDYREIPGVTQEEIQSIEALKSRDSVFIYGMNYTSEAFYKEDGSIGGYAALFCDWMSELFGIKVVPAIIEWEDLVRGLDDGTVDFSGELTSSPERLEKYFMTDAIAERTIKYFTIRGSEALSVIAKQRPLRYAFLEGTLTAGLVEAASAGPLEIVLVGTYEEVVTLLTSGKVDAFFDDGPAEAAFDAYGDIKSDIFFPLIYTPVSLTTAREELAPIISVVQKYLAGDALRHLTGLYNQGSKEYLNHKLLITLTEEERTYIESHSKSGVPIPVAIEYDNYPISFYNEQEADWQGIAIDVLREIRELTGLTFEAANDENGEWQELLEMLEAGEAAMITELIKTAEREGRFLWSREPYSTDNYTLLSSAEHEDISINQILYSKIGLVESAAYTEVFREWFPNHSNTAMYSSTWDAFEAMRNGEVELVMATKNLLLSITNYLEQPGFKANLVFHYPFESCFGFNSNEETLRSVISKAQLLVDTESITDRWTRKVFDYRSKLSQLRNSSLIASSFLLFVVLVLVFVLFIRNKQLSRGLEKTIALRTAELENQTTMLRTIYTSIPDLVFSKDVNSIYTSCNPSFEKFAGCTEAELIGKTDAEIFKIDEEMAELFIEADRKVLRSEKTEVIEEWVVYPDGTRRLLETYKTPIYTDGKTAGMLGISRDITDRKANERAAQAASIAKSEFLARMSHEIRTPLNAIIGMVQIIDPFRQGPEKVKSSVNEISKASNHLLEILNDVLDMSKIESGKLSLASETFHLFGAIDEVVSIIIQRCWEKNIEFLPDFGKFETVHVEGDKLRLKQVLINLLGNAVKFTPSGGKILFSVSMDFETDREATFTFSVSDTGIGMTEEQTTRLFVAFEQADASISSRFGGTGLGLAISQNLVKLMGGQIFVVSRPGRGSVFSFTLTLAKASEPANTARENPAEIPDFPDKRILVVEDIEINRLILAEMLADTHMIIDEVADGQEALEVFSASVEGYYDLIFMDIQMPRMDGYEAARRIRSLDRKDAAEIPIIAMTANAYREDIEQALQSGMNGHISKPIDANTVRRVLVEQLGKSGQDD